MVQCSLKATTKIQSIGYGKKVLSFLKSSRKVKNEWTLKSF